MFGNALRKLLGLDHPQHLQPMQHAQKLAQPMPPDITYNPNPNTNIPYSTHDSNQARQLAQGQIPLGPVQGGGSVQSPQGSNAADPFGWLRNHLRF